jgi:hypothetical protein
VSDLLSAALEYSRRGWKVFPLAPNSKIPMKGSGGVKDATTDTQTIRGWWAKNPSANIGLACGVGDCGPYVIDVDAPNGGHKADGFASLAAAGVSLPSQTWIAETPSGGKHYYYGLQEEPNADELRNCTNANGLLGVDYRAAGGYVVAPPSVIDGKPYQWIARPRYLAPFPPSMYLKPKSIQNTLTAAPVVAPVADDISSADTTERARLYLASCDAAISGSGGHNATLHAAHALVVGFGLNDADALSLLMNEYNPRCVPPWTERELRHKVESARNNPQKPLGYLLNERLTNDNKGLIDNETQKLGTDVAAQFLHKTGTKQNTPKADDFAARYARRRRLDEFKDPLPEEDDPDVLFKNGWLKRGGGAFFVSVSGAGKSVAATQAAACWGVGRPFFGIAPVRPLRIAVYQAEDDAQEVADFRNNIRRGLLAEGWTADEIADSERASVYHDVTGLSGDSFIEYLRKAQRMDCADLVIINPLQSFAGCDISKNAELSRFLRVQLNPILADSVAPCAAFIVHHTNKVPANAKDRKSWLDTNSAAYGGAGGAELVNWARAVLTLRPHERAGYYDLIAAKRGKRLGWTNATGAQTNIKTLAHSDGVMFWREADADELSDIETGQQLITNALCQKVVALVRQSGSYPSKAALVEAIASERVCQRTAAYKIIKACIESGDLIERRANGGFTRALSICVGDASGPRKTNEDELPF